MTSSPERQRRGLPPALASMWRLCKLGYSHEPGCARGGVLARTARRRCPTRSLRSGSSCSATACSQADWRLVRIAAVALAVSATGTWFLRTVGARVQRRFRDKVTIALESHVARLLASIATIAHQERPEYLDRLAVLRDQVFMLDHMYMSLFSTCGWILRLGVTIALLMSIHPALGAAGGVRVADRADIHLAPRRGARAPMNAAPGRAGLRATCSTGDHGAARQGGARHRHRRPPRQRIDVRPGSAGTSRCRARALGLGSLAHAGLDGIRRGLRRRYRVRVVRARRIRRATSCWCSRRGRGSPRTSGRRWARSASCAASGWTARGVSRGSRTTPPRSSRARTCRRPHGLRRASASSTSRSPIPAPRAWCSTTCRCSCRQVPSSPSSARTAPARPRWSSCSPRLRALVGRHPGRRHAARPHPCRPVARADGGRVPGLLPLRVHRAAHHRSRRRASAG